jgi:hypothetical protein
MEGYCGDCDYWVAGELANPRPHEDGNCEPSEVRQCRLHAPRPALFDDPTQHERWASWPLTYASDWCGEHPARQPREEEQHA